MINIFKYISIIFFIFFINNTFANDNLKILLSQFNTLTADFKQENYSEENELIQSSSGHLILKKDNFVFWETYSPEELIIVSDSKDIFYYDPFIEQVTIQSFEKSIKHNPLLVIANENSTSWEHLEIKEEKDNFILKFEESNIEYFSLYFKNNKIYKITIKDKTGHFSHFTLSNVKYNIEYKNEKFQFTIPEGVEINNQRN